MSYEILLDGFLQAHNRAKQEDAGMYCVWGGEYDDATKGIILNLDVLMEAACCFNDGGFCGKAKDACIEKFIEKFTATVTHEHIHAILDMFDNGSCVSFDNIDLGDTEEAAPSTPGVCRRICSQNKGKVWIGNLKSE